MRLAPDEIHLWFVFQDEIRDAALLEEYRGLLTSDEEARRRRFIVERARHEFLVARALVRTTLSRYRDGDPRGWRFEKNEHGRPDLVPDQLGSPALRFNLSHTKGLMVLAVALGRDLGVDVEDTRRHTDGVAIADRFFSRDEVMDLHRLPAHHQQDRFFDYWTLKEAYIKARGMGLALPLGGFTYRLLQGPPPRIEFAPEVADLPAEWQFALFSPSTRHRAAVAIRRGARGARDLKITARQVVPLAGEERRLEPAGVFHL